jgi:hypothetical protein
MLAFLKLGQSDCKADPRFVRNLAAGMQWRTHLDVPNATTAITLLRFSTPRGRAGSALVTRLTAIIAESIC